LCTNVPLKTLSFDSAEIQVHQLVGSFVGDGLGIRVGSLLSGVGSRVVGNLVGLGLGNSEGLGEG